VQSENNWNTATAGLAIPLQGLKACTPPPVIFVGMPDAVQPGQARQAPVDTPLTYWAVKKHIRAARALRSRARCAVDRCFSRSSSALRKIATR